MTAVTAAHVRAAAKTRVKQPQAGDDRPAEVRDFALDLPHRAVPFVGQLRTKAASSGSGYQAVRFSDAEDARLAAQDETASPAIYSNNRQCSLDVACRK